MLKPGPYNVYDPAVVTAYRDYKLEWKQHGVLSVRPMWNFTEEEVLELKALADERLVWDTGGEFEKALIDFCDDIIRMRWPEH